MSLIPDEVQMVYFDAVGTLLFPDPPVAEAYRAIGRREGSRLTLDEVRRGFYAAFAAEEAIDAKLGHRTDEWRETQRWRSIVAATLPDVTHPFFCFAELYHHFALARNWRIGDGVLPILRALRCRFAIGLASNFDGRLNMLLEDMPDLSSLLSHVVISQAIGWRKPAPQFFAALCNGYAPNQVLLVGDDRVNDYDGARAAGLHAILLDESTTLSDLLP